MPEPVAGGAAVNLLRGAIGFYGKLPARGDFVRFGLPRSFIAPWDDWLQRGMAESRTVMGDDWEPAWFAAPAWRFALAPGLCGPDAVLGVWLASVDRVGRCFPLTLAVVAAGADSARLRRDGGRFLAAAERAGRRAIGKAIDPADLAAAIGAAAAEPPANCGLAPGCAEPSAALWWTEGGARVAASCHAEATLPPPSAFARMIDTRYRSEPAR